jgi:hypothetical protein
VIIQKIVKDSKSAGGHDLFAGGKMKLESASRVELVRIQDEISQEFVRVFGYRDVHWKKMIEEP